MDSKNFLFIGGCARSGTSVLTKIISSHSEIVLGMERYNSLCSKEKFRLTKEHFTKERFLRMEKGDTFYTAFERFKIHTNIHTKWDCAKYVGVKYPRVIEIVDELKLVFGSIIFLYMYRNVYDVAESWNGRAAKGENWPTDKDYAKAVFQWSQSLSLAKEHINRGEKIICINYEDLLFTEKPIDSIFELLDLEVDNEVLETLKEARLKAANKRAKKGKLIEEHYQFVKKNAQLDLYDEFNTKYNILR